MLTYNELSKAIYRRRVEQELTQRQLAEMSGVSRNSIQRLEKNITINTKDIFRICRVLGLELSIAEVKTNDD